MKKYLVGFFVIILLLFFIFVASYYSKNGFGNKNNITGNWLQIETDWSGDITDFRNSKHSYLKIDKSKLVSYTYFGDTYIVGEKYYKLEDKKIYYDSNELKGSNFKEKIDVLSGGIYHVTKEKDKLILTSYNSSGGYTKDTYIKVDNKDWPVKE